MYTITRTHEGINCLAKQLPTTELHKIFDYAVSCYGTLLNIGEQLTGIEWINRIKSVYSIDEPRTKKVIESIQIAMCV